MATKAFVEHHALSYGLEVVGRDVDSGAATSVVCLFCRHFGREERPGRKRKSTGTIRHFRDPFHTYNYLDHITTQHPTQWEKYNQSSDEIKCQFFPIDETRSTLDKKKIEGEMNVMEAATAAKQLPVEKRRWFFISKRIADLVVPLATITDFRGWKPPGFKAFELMELSRAQAEGFGGQTSGEYYQIAIFTRLELDVTVASLATEMNPLQVSMHLKALANHTTAAGGAAPLFPLLEEAEVRELARLTVGTNMQSIGQLLSRSWGFGLVLREETGVSRVEFLDVRVVVYVQDKLRDLHVLALPLSGQHNSLTLAQTIEDVLTTIFPPWRTRVLGFTQNGRVDTSEPETQSTSTSSSARTTEICTLLETSIKTSSTPNCVLHIMWGSCRPLARLLSSFYDSLFGGKFVRSLDTLTAYVRQSPELLQEMGPPPMLKTADESLVASVDFTVDDSYLAMGLHTQWISDKRVRLRKYLEQHSPLVVGAAAPVDNAWWVAFFVVHWVATGANETFEKLRSPRISRSQPKQMITEMLTELVAAFNIQRGRQTEGEEKRCHSNQSKFSILKSNVDDFLYDQGLFVISVASRLDPDALDPVLQNLSICVVNLAEALDNLSNSLPVDEAALLPPSLPQELARLSGTEFTTLLQQYGEQLRGFYSDEELDTIKQEHQALRRSATRETELKAALAQCRAESPFAEAWGLTQGKFPLLQAFAGGLASAYACRETGSKKSVVGLSVGDSEGNAGLRLAAMDFGLETTLHTRQFAALRMISDHQDHKG
ncbi:hypothetical protein V7S43_006624 [Phytophthora oleae]|uniref:HAT C-terminal dimerisation domain-containing protein n=1 Tax=Phytophthora oleae TaxID=2107226 RepID=A0ABD3FQ12_9STRA